MEKNGFYKKELSHLFVHLFTTEYLSDAIYLPDVELLSRHVTMGKIAVVFAVSTQKAYYRQTHKKNNSNDGLKCSKVNTDHYRNSTWTPLT